MTEKDDEIKRLRKAILDIREVAGKQRPATMHADVWVQIRDIADKALRSGE